MKGLDGKTYDFTQMRKVYTSQNRNRMITQENKGTFGKPQNTQIKLNSLERMQTKVERKVSEDDLSLLGLSPTFPRRQTSIIQEPFTPF